MRKIKNEKKKETERTECNNATSSVRTYDILRDTMYHESVSVESRDG